MVVNKTSRIITSIITIFVAALIGIIIFFVKQNKYKKNKCYTDSIITTDEYELSFEKFFNTTNGRAAVYIEITVTNKTNTEFSAKFTDVIVRDDSKTEHKAKSVTLTVPTNSEDYYCYGYYCDNNNDTNKYILHFKLNGKAYNVCFKNKPIES